jgi:hypothetical protein
VAGRAQAFSDPTVIALTSERFIPVAENCSPLHRQEDAKGTFFRLVAEQGHYAGRRYPTSTRQGYYAFTADGKVLAAANSRDPQRMTELLQTALQRWSVLSEDGAGAARGEGPGDYVPAQPDRFPESGLVLRQVARDLPREVDTRPDDWRKHAWNLDYAWFTAEEAAALVPAGRRPGETGEAPAAVVRRIARFHLRDFVRGEPSVWPEAAVREARLTSEVLGTGGGRVRLALRGAVRLQWDSRWVRPEDAAERASDCGIDATLYGEAEWDEAAGRFVAFDLLAAGPRWGTNQYNNRQDDLGPAPLGIAFELAGTAPRDRTPPHTVYHREYFAAGGEVQQRRRAGAPPPGR